MKKITLLILSLASAFSLAQAAVNYTLSTGAWEDGATWGGTKPATPITADNVCIIESKAVTISSAENLTSRITVGLNGSSGTFMLSSGTNLAHTGRLYVGDRNHTGTSVMTVSSGATYTQTCVDVNVLYVGNGQNSFNGEGELHINGGAFYTNASQTNGNIFVGHVNNVATLSSAGTISVTAGTFSVTASTISFAALGIRGTQSANLILSGGTFSAIGAVLFGNNSSTATAIGKATISSKMDHVFLGNSVTFAGESELYLSADKLSSWTGKSIVQTGGAFTMGADTTLIIDFSNFGLWDSATLNETITITLIAYGDYDYLAATPTIIEGDAAQYFDFDNLTWGANGLTIDVTYARQIPEPAAAAALLGALALATISRRRK